MNYIVRGYDEMEFGDRPFYGRFLEQGTKKGKMKPRPHLSRTVEERNKDNEDLVEYMVDREIKNNAR